MLVPTIKRLGVLCKYCAYLDILLLLLLLYCRYLSRSEGKGHCIEWTWLYISRICDICPQLNRIKGKRT